MSAPAGGGYTEREKRLALATGLILGAALLWVTGIGPALKEHRDLTSELGEARDRVARQERTNRADKPYKSELRDLQKALKTSDDAAFWKALEADIARRGLKLTSYQRSSPERKAKSGYAIVRYNLNLEGDKVSLLKVLHSFQETDGFLCAQTVSTTRRRDGKLAITMAVSTLIPLGGS